MSTKSASAVGIRVTDSSERASSPNTGVEITPGVKPLATSAREATPRWQNEAGETALATVTV